MPLTEVGALLDAGAGHGGRTAYDHLLALAASNGLRRRRVGEVLARMDGLVNGLDPEGIAKGRTNSEICDDPWLSVPTIKTHIGNLLAKTHSRDRVPLVLHARRTGIASING